MTQNFHMENPENTNIKGNTKAPLPCWVARVDFWHIVERAVVKKYNLNGVETSKFQTSFQKDPLAKILTLLVVFYFHNKAVWKQHETFICLQLHLFILDTLLSMSAFAEWTPSNFGIGFRRGTDCFGLWSGWLFHKNRTLQLTQLTIVVPGFMCTWSRGLHLGRSTAVAPLRVIIWQTWSQISWWPFASSTWSEQTNSWKDKILAEPISSSYSCVWEYFVT